MPAESERFDSEDLACPCCGEMEITTEALHFLEIFCDQMDEHIRPSSAYRCLRRNQAVGGAPESAHLTGEGFDFPCKTSARRFQIVDAALACGATGIGIAPDHVHVDVRNRAKKMWLEP